MALPQLFVIGDSISIYYGPHLERILQGKFAYSRKLGDEALQNLDIPVGANGGDSSMVLDFLRIVARSADFRPDILMVNCGMHDIKTDPHTGAKQIPLDQYRENLRQIVALAGEIGTRMVWVRTTTLEEERHNAIQYRWFLRYSADVDAYNAVADEVMRETGVSVIDLHNFTRNLGGELYIDHAHFTDRVSECQAAFIAGTLCALAEG